MWRVRFPRVQVSRNLPPDKFKKRLCSVAGAIPQKGRARGSSRHKTAGDIFPIAVQCRVGDLLDLRCVRIKGDARPEEKCGAFLHDSVILMFVADALGRLKLATSRFISGPLGSLALNSHLVSLRG